MMRKGLFREDLYYRLDVVNLVMPRLADRREDVPRLVARFVARNQAQTGKALRGLSDEAMALLMHYDFPGNVRELENAIEHGFVLCREGYIQPHHLPEAIQRDGHEWSARPRRGTTNARQTAEIEVIRRALERAGGNRIQAAEALEMHRTTLWRKLRKYGLT
jgi:transcriptional regulator with PAS, ATPase and Fis domain